MNASAGTAMSGSDASDLDDDGQHRSLPYNPALDGLRGVAILLVLLHHFRIPHDRESFGSSVYINLRDVGWVGVDLFFVLSGFLIGSILIKSYGKKSWIRTFVLRRALRVLPLYFFVIFVCFNIVTLVPMASLDWLRALAQDQWWYWLHLANFRKIMTVYDPSVASVGWFSTYWSLSIEEHFYLIWPLVLAVVGPRRIGKASVCGIALVLVLRSAVAVSGVDYTYIYYNTFTRLDGLMLGSLLGWANEFHRETLLRLSRFAAPVFIVGCLAFLIPMLMGYYGGGRNTLYGKNVLYIASVIVAGASVWVLVTRPPSNVVFRWMSSKIFISFGAYSYAIYVFNKPIMYAFSVGVATRFGKLDTWAVLLVWVIACCVCYLVGLVSWHLIEKPFLKLKKYVPSPVGDAGK